MKSLEGGLRAQGEIWVPTSDPAWKGGLMGLSGEDAVKWREEWFGLVLKNHPDVWFADDLKFKQSCDQLLVNRENAGLCGLETLSTQARPEIAKKAKALVGLLKQKAGNQNSVGQKKAPKS